MTVQNSSTPAVSIVIPCYNVEKYLPSALDSALAQSLKNIEIICVNDGSKDGTLNVIKEYMAKDSRIKLIDKPNGGYGESMNRGFEAAQGEYIGILESDDLIEPDMYELLYKAAKDNGDLDFVRSDYFKFYTDKDGKDIIWVEDVSPRPEYYNCVLNPQDNLDLFNIRMENWTGIYRNDFITKHNIKHHESPGASYQDNGFWFQTYCFATKIMILHKPFYHYRQDNASSSINQNNKVYSMFEEYAWIYNLLEQNPTLKEKFVGIYHYKKTHNLNFIYSILAPEYKAEFLERYSKEYNQALLNGELDKQYFWPDEWDAIQQIMNNPRSFLVREKEENPREIAINQAKEHGLISLFLTHLKYDGLINTTKMVLRKIKG